MNIDAAREVCAQLFTDKLRADVVEGPLVRVAAYTRIGRAHWKTIRSARIVFSGGAFGEHSIDVHCSSRDRLYAHWSGYVSANEQQRAS